MVRAAPLVLAVVAAAGVAGCAARAQSRPAVEMPELAPPPAPPRVIEPYAPEPAAETSAAPAEATPPATAPRPPQRPAPRPPDPPPPAAEPARPPTPPALTLRPAAGAEAQTEQSIRALLARAARDLARVNPAGLAADRRAQYDTAHRFLQQADDALKARNLMFAGKLADKAATMAAVLVR